QFEQSGRGNGAVGLPPRALTHVMIRSMDALKQRSETDAEGRVIVRTAEPSFRPKLHILYAAHGTGQARQLVRHLADVLADQRFQDRWQVQLVLLGYLLLLFRALLAQVHLFLLAFDDVGQMHCGRIGTRLALHDSSLRERRRTTASGGPKLPKS